MCGAARRARDTSGEPRRARDRGAACGRHGRQCRPHLLDLHRPGGREQEAVARDARGVARIHGVDPERHDGGARFWVRDTEQVVGLMLRHERHQEREQLEHLGAEPGADRSVSTRAPWVRAAARKGPPRALRYPSQRITRESEQEPAQAAHSGTARPMPPQELRS